MGQTFLEDMVQQGAFVSKRDSFEKEAARSGGSGGSGDGGGDQAVSLGIDLMRVLNGRDPEPPTPSAASLDLAHEMVPELEKLGPVAEK